jgi:ubiquinone biosynthesis O-methyltransferase
MNQTFKDELLQVWNKESESYRMEAVNNPDYLAHFEIVEETIKQKLEELKGKKVLDVGSGTGITTAYLASQGAIVTLVDISQKALDFSKRFFSKNKLAVKTIKADAFRMKFKSESFDVVWNGGVIEHFDDDQKVILLKKMWGLVKPGGVLLITVPNARDLPFMLAKKILVWRNKWAFGYEDDLTQKKLIRLIKSAGVSTGQTFAYNPIVGWWFFPYGREITSRMGLNRKNYHKLQCWWGHNIVFCAKKMVK